MKSFYVLLTLFFCLACNKKSNTTDQGSPVSGIFTIHTDDSYLPLVKVLTDAFMATYPQVVIYIDTVSGENIYSRLSKETIHSAITSMPPKDADSIALRDRNIFPKFFHFATDAIGLIAKSGSDSLTQFSFSNTEEACLQNSIMPVVSRLITDRPGSENNNYLASIQPVNLNCQQNWFAVGNQEAVLKRISENESEIGIIGWSHLCEKENPGVKKWRAQLSVIPFRNEKNELIYPTQSAILTGEYPLHRQLFLITTEPYTGPATGFASFMASHEGQRIVRLFGLAPAKTPPREIIVN